MPTAPPPTPPASLPKVPTKIALPSIKKADYRLLAAAIGILVYGSVGFYVCEKDAWPDLTYGDSLWWALVTAMTVGYGDVYPKTWKGRWLVAAPTILLGVGLLAHTFGLSGDGGKLKYVWG
jgi:hypothetical protein